MDIENLKKSAIILQKYLESEAKVLLLKKEIESKSE